MSDAPLLALRHITQAYGPRERPLLAIDDVNLTLREGELLALLGPSGCGKSTLLRIATGLQAPTRGEVEYRGQRARGVNPKASIVFQTFALFPWLTIAENVEVALKAQGVSASERHARALAALDRVGLDGFESAYPRELSGGMPARRQASRGRSPSSLSCSAWTSPSLRSTCSAARRCATSCSSCGPPARRRRAPFSW
jgi:NitT/TauT family transport system ATP-binding protein